MNIDYIAMILEKIDWRSDDRNSIFVSLLIKLLKGIHYNSDNLTLIQFSFQFGIVLLKFFIGNLCLDVTDTLKKLSYDINKITYLFAFRKMLSKIVTFIKVINYVTNTSCQIIGSCLLIFFTWVMLKVSLKDNHHGMKLSLVINCQFVFDV